MVRCRLVLLALCLMPLMALSKPEKPVKTEAKDPFQQVIEKHFKAYNKLEYFSGIQVSIKAGDELKTYTVGYHSHAKQTKLSAKDLFQIGSITKSFTAALALLAEKAGQLKMDNPVKDYLTAYPHWQNLRLISLLNMTSGLPNYSNAPKINMGFVDNIKRYWNRTELIDLVYNKDFNPPLRSGYDYTNTGYVIMDIILSQKGRKTYNQLLQEHIIKPLGLKNTFYPLPSANTEVNKRLVSGYAYNVYVNPELVGRDVRENNLSWAGAAGGIVSNSEDVVHWVEELFLKEKLLTKEQKVALKSLISLKTGKPIKKTTREDTRGFGLGVIQAYDEKIGRYWYYQGETLGYRALYMFVPCNKVIISTLYNSATNDDNDHSGKLMVELYQQLLKSNPKIKACRS